MAVGYHGTRISRPPRRVANFEFPSGDHLYRVHDLPHRIASAVTAVENSRSAALPQVIQRRKMCPRQIGHMHVATHTGAVRRRVVAAKDAHVRTAAECGLDRYFDQMGGT